MNGSDFVHGGVILVVLGALLAYCRNLPGKIWRLFERNFVTRVEVYDDDESFQWVRLWLTEQLQGTRSVAVFTKKQKKEEYDDLPEEKEHKPKIFFTPAPGFYFFRFMKKIVIVTRERKESEGKSDNILQKPRETFIIRIFSRNTQIAKNLIETARDYALPEDGKIEVRSSQAGYWRLIARVSKRPLESVVLSGNLVKDLISDLNLFTSSESWYKEKGIPYRRGYLLYGPPGSGKTSLVLAIAGYLEMNLSVLNLSSPGMSDSKLVELLAEAGTDIILIEDIDCAFENRSRGTDRKDKSLDSLTFSGLLNALDGIIGQDGRIIFYTTNHPDKLDAALTRPGRADVKVEIGNATKEQAYKMFERFFPNSGLATKFAEGVKENTSMAEIQNHLMTYRDNCQKASAFNE